MYTKRNYGFWMTFNWSKWPFIFGLAYASAVALVFYLLQSLYKIDISLNWQPVSVLGIAVAFYLGFKNNSSYDRTWEARKIWGGIVNNSRTFGVALNTFINGPAAESIKKALIYRHIAWLTALRYQLRLSREWEHTDDRIKNKYVPQVCEEYIDRLEKEVIFYISENEYSSWPHKVLNCKDYGMKVIMKISDIWNSINSSQHFTMTRVEAKELKTSPSRDNMHLLRCG